MSRSLCLSVTRYLGFMVSRSLGHSVSWSLGLSICQRRVLWWRIVARASIKRFQNRFWILVLRPRKGMNRLSVSFGTFLYRSLVVFVVSVLACLASRLSLRECFLFFFRCTDFCHYFAIYSFSFSFWVEVFTQSSFAFTNSNLRQHLSVCLVYTCVSCPLPCISCSLRWLHVLLSQALGRSVCRSLRLSVSRCGRCLALSISRSFSILIS